MATLYTWSGNSNGQVIQSVAALSNQNLTVKNVDPGAAIEGFPSYASAPCLSTKQGQNLTQLSSILAELSGNSSSELLEWVSFAENVLTPAASAWVFPCLGAMPNNKGAINEGKKSLLSSLEFLNGALSSRTFLVGERPSAADAAVCGAVNLAFKHVLSEEYRKNIVHVVRWFLTCVNQPEFSSFGKTALCDKEAQFDAKTFGEINKKAGKQDNKKEKAPAKKQEKKKEPKKEKPKEAPLEVAKEPKSKDPWAGLGGTVDFDAWKRMYSNNDTVPTAMDYFWNIYDKENYSIWYGKYKYGDEIAMPFMASNLVRGMFQRLDKMRKNSMGSVCVFGSPPNIEISGVWFFKGQGLAFELSPDWGVDYDTYDWKKLDADNEEDRKTITHYFAQEGWTDDRVFRDGKVWK